jgi:hypothetical protein
MLVAMHDALLVAGLNQLAKRVDIVSSQPTDGAASLRLTKLNTT